jgi:hypothetical protein
MDDWVSLGILKSLHKLINISFIVLRCLSILDSELEALNLNILDNSVKK